MAEVHEYFRGHGAATISKVSNDRYSSMAAVRLDVFDKTLQVHVGDASLSGEALDRVVEGSGTVVYRGIDLMRAGPYIAAAVQSMNNPEDIAQHGPVDLQSLLREKPDPVMVTLPRARLYLMEERRRAHG